MKVYLLCEASCNDIYHVAVLSSKEKAELHRDVLQQYSEDGHTYYVKEFEVKD